MVTINKSFVPIKAVHPSEIIKDEMQARGLKQKDLAQRLGMLPPNLNSILKEQRAITLNVANKLEDALGIPAEFWLSAQAQYERDCREIEQQTVKEKEASIQEKILSDIFNLRILFQRVGIVASLSSDRIKALWSHFGVNNPTDLILRCQIQGMYKKSDRCTQDEKNMNTWLILADRASRASKPLGSYTFGNAKSAAQSIAKLTNAGQICESNIKEILGEYGIGYEVVEKLEKVPVDGYSRYTQNPCVVVTHRYNDLHKLVFVVLHELGHIHLHLKDNNSEPFASAFGDGDGDLEDEANLFARDALIPQDTWNKILDVASTNMHPNTISTVLQNQARKYGVNIHIALQRFQYETGMYKMRRPKSVPIH